RGPRSFGSAKRSSARGVPGRRRRMGWFDRLLSLMGLEVEAPDEEVAVAEEPQEEAPRSRRRPRSQPAAGSVVALPSKGDVGSHVVLFRPRGFNDVQVVADHLKQRRAVLVNLEGADRELAHRITNFLSGTIYALNGEMHAINPT